MQLNQIGHYLQKYLPYCTVEGCKRPHYSRTLCKSHYARLNNYERGAAQTINLKPLDKKRVLLHSKTHKAGFIGCSVNRCKRKHYAKKLCHSHYQYQRSKKITPPGRSCTYKDCKRLHWAKGFCANHQYVRKLKNKGGI